MARRVSSPFATALRGLPGPAQRGERPRRTVAIFTTAVIVWLEVLLTVGAVFGLLIGFAAGMLWLMGR